MKSQPEVFIVDGICVNFGDYICNLGYACDACPYNPENHSKEELIEWIYRNRKKLVK
jgi:hypothetical protein